MPIEVKCHCGAEYRLDNSRACQDFTCKVCGAQMHLTVGSPRAVPPPAVPPVVLAHEGTALSADADAMAKAAKPASARQRQTTAAGGGTPALDLGSDESPAEEPPPIITGPDGAEQSHVTRWPQAWSKPQPDPPLPVRWIVIRGVIWAVCTAFIFVPWYNMPQGISSPGPLTVTPLPGWRIIGASLHAIVSGVGDPRTGLARALPEMVGLDSLPSDGTALAGAALMVFSPTVYAGSLVLGLLVAVAAINRGGRGLALPFVLYWLSLLGFLSGWLMVSQVVPVWRAGADVDTVGASIWVYTMLLALVPMTLLVRTRPESTVEAMLVIRRRDGDQLA